MKSAPQLDSFVFDENLSRQLAQALQLLDPDTVVSYVTEFFEAGADDTVFLPEIGRRTGGRLEPLPL